MFVISIFSVILKGRKKRKIVNITVIWSNVVVYVFKPSAWEREEVALSEFNYST